MENLNFVEVCRCCLEEGVLRSLWSEHLHNDSNEVYGETIKQCFDVDIPRREYDKICLLCVNKLYEASAFKELILNSQLQLIDSMEISENSISTTEDVSDNNITKNDIDEIIAEYLELDANEEKSDKDEQDVEILVNETPPLETLPKRNRTIDKFNVVKVVKRKVLPTRETLIRAVQAVKEKKMTISAAKKFYNINGYCLKKIIRDGIDLETVNLATLNDSRKNKSYSIEKLKMSTDFVKEGKLTKNKAAELFNLPIRAIEYRMSKGFKEDYPEKLINNRRVNAKGVVIVEIDNRIARNPRKFTRSERLSLEESVKQILKYTNATPYLVLGNNFVCGYCNDTFQEPNDLREHVLLHEKMRHRVDLLLRPAEAKEIMRLDIHNLKCVECNITLKWSDVYTHLTDHGVTIDKKSIKKIIPFNLIPYKYGCVFCDTEESRYMKLEVHMSVHFNNYICEECGREFLIYSKMKTHEYQERQKKINFKCEMCEDMIVGRNNYEAHMSKVHDNPVRFPCKYCSERFGDQYRRHMHMKERHSELLKPIKCKECDKVFIWKGFYQAHYRKVHLKERKYQCSFCLKQFFATDSYKKHLMIHNDVQCGKCGRRFLNRLQLNSHLKDCTVMNNDEHL